MSFGLPRTVRGRIVLGFGVIITLLAVIVVAAVWLTREYRDATAEAQTHAATADLLNRFSQNGSNSIIYLQFYLTTGNEEILARSDTYKAAALSDLDLAAAVQANAGNVDEADQINGIRTEATAILEQTQAAVQARQAGDVGAALGVLAQTLASIEVIGVDITNLQQTEQAHIDELTKHADAVSDFAMYALILAGALGLFVAIGSAWVLGRSILRPLAGLEAAAKALTSGDLDARAPTSGPVELSALGSTFNTMTEGLLDASKRRELEAQRDTLVHDLHERVKELTAIHQVSRLVQDNIAITEVAGGIARALPPAFQYPDTAGARVIIDDAVVADFGFESTPWTLATEFATDTGQKASLEVCYRREHPEADDGPFLTEECHLLVAIGDVLRSYLERRRAEDVARQSIERFSTAFHASPVPVSIVRMRDGQVIDVNEAFLEVLGYRRKDLIGRLVSEFALWGSEEDRVRFYGQIEREKRALHDEYTLRTKGGELRTMYGSAEVMQLDGEDCILSSFYDVTARKQTELALRESEMRWQSLVDHTSDLVTIIDPTGKILFQNPSVTSVLGYDPREKIGANAFGLIHPDDAEPVLKRFLLIVQNPDTAQTTEFRYRHKDGSYRYVSAVGSVMRDEAGTIAGVIVVSRDMTERRQMEERIEFQARLLGAAGESVIATDTSGIIQYWNAAAERIYGWSEEEAIGKQVYDLMWAGETPPQRFELLTQVSGHDAAPLEYVVGTKSGERIPVEVSYSLLSQADGTAIGLIGVSHDISERKRTEETIRHMAYHDVLTGLPNRLLLKDRFEAANASAQRHGYKLCILSADLDRFKIVNDTLGHIAGDELLQAAAGRFRSLVHNSDTVARIGGDEFVIVLAECMSVTDGIDTASRIVEAFRQPFQLGDNRFHLTLSVGISFYPDDGEDFEAVMSVADAAMRAVKDAGRDGYRIYGPNVNTRNSGWLALDAELRRALQGQIEVFYQPQVSVQTGEITGMEALARWRHPERGIIPPAEFIPIAEETALIVPLGEFMLRRSCEQAMDWANEGLPVFRLAVNVSVRQFERPDFVAKVGRIMAETGFPPSRLELEITENTALRDVDLTRTVATQLAAMGISLALDDFGTGSTALRYLTDFPINTLKIDRTFISDMATNKSNAAIATSVIALGHSLSLNVIAEGVETDEQLDMLKQYGCDEFQGFIHSRPMPADEARQLLLDSSRTAAVA